MKQLLAYSFSPMDYSFCLDIFWGVMNTAATTCACFYFAFLINDRVCSVSAFVCPGVCVHADFHALPSLLLSMIKWARSCHGRCPTPTAQASASSASAIRTGSGSDQPGIREGWRRGSLGLGLKPFLGPLWLKEREVGRPPCPHGL